MSELTDELTAEQSAAVAVVWKPFKFDGHWPIYQFVAEQLHELGLPPQATLASFPGPGHAVGGGVRYRAVHYEQAGMSRPNPEGLVRLTVAGLRHVDDDNGLVADFLKLVAHLVTVRRTAIYSPRQVVKVQVTRKEVAALYPYGPPMRMEHLHAMAQLEPPTWGGGTNQQESPVWWADLGPEIRGYDGVIDVEDYLTHVAAELTAVKPAVRPEPPADMALVWSIDYLSTAWKVRFRKYLIEHVTSLERAARLSHPVRTAAEFEAALSAFTEILAHFHVEDPPAALREEGQDMHPLAKMEVYLTPARLGRGDRDRVLTAMGTLNAIRVVRNGIHHVKSEPAAFAALHELGIGYPVMDWGWAWDAIRIAAAEAFHTIREEVQISGRI